MQVNDSCQSRTLAFAAGSTPPSASSMKKIWLLRAGFFWYKGRFFSLAATLVFFFAASLQANAKATGQSITLTERDASLEAVFKKIEKQTGYHFWYENQLMRQAKKVTIAVKNATVDDVLSQCMKDQPLTYTIVEKTIVIKQKAAPANGFPHTVNSVSVTMNTTADDVTGRVTSDKGEPVAGATVQLKGTNTATSTDADGRFRLSVPSASSAVLIISYVGYETQEVAVSGRNNVSVALAARQSNMNEVVVTALGIRREARRLGYSTATVNTDQVSVNRTPNVGNSLEGKVAGLNVSPPAGGPGGSTKIRIRGQSSFGGDNSPLIVVNGIPINNSSISGGQGGQTGNPTGGSSDQGDGLQSINPDDIESITVLKGAPAAALYGFRAKDGVLLITTKSGRGVNGIGVELNSNFQSDQALDYTNFQYEYGQGENGKRPVDIADAQKTGVHSFGEKFDGKPTPQFDGTSKPYQPYKNRIKDFYRTGYTWTNSVALSGGSDKGAFRVSFANTDANAIMPNSDFHKKILNVGLNYKFTNQLSMQLNANYSNEYNHNPPQIGLQDMNANTTIYTMANSIDVAWLRETYKDANGNEQPLSRFTNRNNPYWVTLNRFEKVRRDRIFGNASLRYQLLDWLYVQGRVGQDYYTRPYEYNRPTGTRSISAVSVGFNGQYYQDVTTFRERNLDFLIGANRTFGKFGIDLTVGGNQMQQVFDRIRTNVTNFYVRDLYTIGNGQTKDPGYDFSKNRVNSLYGAAELSYGSSLYLTLTSRTDWFSTLNPASNHITYPSASLSYVFTSSLKGMPSWLNFGKLRGGYAEVGGATDAYSNSLYYNVGSVPFNGVGLGNINGTTSPNANLRPSRTKETEIGLELRMFNSRVNLDIAAYKKITIDQILDIDISNASGFSKTKVNIGKSQNKGIESMLTLVPVRGKNISWETVFNTSYNISKVLQLANGQTAVQVGTGEFFGNVAHEVGLPLASLRGFDYKLDPKTGKVITSGGLFQQGKLTTFGSAIPKWTGGWMNTVTFKGIRIFTQIDYKAGYKIMSNSNLNFLRHGLSQASLVGREGGVLFDGINADGTPNTTRVEAEAFYSQYRGTNIATPFIYNGSFVRWRSLSIGYDFSRFLKTSRIKGLTVSALVNNVLMIKKYIDNLDPEAQVSASDNLQGIETHTLPTTRSFGVNVNIKF